MIVWGGYAFGSPGTLGTGGRYDPVQDVWSPTSLAGAPAPRAYHTAVWTGREMIVWGGYGAELFNTGGRYDALADAWTPTSTTAAPFGRSQQTAVWTGREMIVWGGIYDASGYSYSTNTGGRYDPAADSWSPTTTVGAPDGRELHTAVWTGTAMIVRGGEYDSGDVIQLVRDLRVAWYGAPAAAPSPDTDQDGFSVCAGDCDDAEASIYPGAPQICGDRLNNDCSDPAWPTLVGTNEGDDDGDGLSECAGDCDDTNGAAWGTPAEVAGLEVQGADPALLSWGAVTGGGVLVRYDTLRSGVAGDFLSGATCIESDDGSDTTASDAVPPAAGRIFFYLIRAENACPSPAGMGPLGFASSGSPRQGRACP